MNFDQAFEKLLGHEGGYVNDPRDPGGETKFGVTKRTYPGEDIKALTVARAKEIYLRDFWGPAGCDAVPDGVRFDLFDTAVNSGVRRAVKLVQQTVGETQDGVLGTRTLQALQSLPPTRFVARFNGARLAFMCSLPAWRDFSKGWALRVAANLMEA